MTPLAKLQAAESGSLELDREVHLWACRLMQEVPSGVDEQSFREHEAKNDYMTAYTAHYSFICVPNLTTSIDAALALVERVLPEANCYGFDKTPKEFEAYVCRDCVWGHWAYSGIAATPALAICVALVRAREAEDERI